jgi:MFS family permease
MQLAALAWVVAVETRSGTKTLLLVFLGTIPLVVLSPVGGHLADRFPRRRLMLWTTGAQTLIAFALWFTWFRGAGSYWALAVFSILGGTAGALNSPAWQALVPELVPRDDLRNAVMLNSAQFNIARATGPAIAGLMIDRVGEGPVFLVNALSFLAVIAALLVMSESPPREHVAGTSFLSQWHEGYRYARTRPGIVLALASAGCVALCGAPIIQLIPLLSIKVLHIGASKNGLLIGVFGLGAVTAALIVGGLSDRVSNGSVVRWAWFLYPGSIVALALSPTYAIGMIAMVGLGGGFLALTASHQNAVHMLTDDRYRGRVLALWLTLFGAFYPIGSLIQGNLSDLVGVRAVLLGDAAVLFAFSSFVRARGLFRHLP